jgi:predicted Zn finger-like uncharacterized protein
MKFFCDSCSTKYSISDEKVRGKILKVRCKNCGHVITVREQRLPTESSDVQEKPKRRTRPPKPPSSPQFDPSSVEWHYALNGQSFGPFELEALRERYRSGDLGDETYVWTDSFSNWKPVSEVEWFQDALAQGQERKPRKKTIGVSGALEAIKPEDVEKFQDEQNEKASNTQRQRAVEDDRQAAQQDRLHALRARLKSGEQDEEQADSELSDEFDGGAETVVGSSAQDYSQDADAAESSGEGSPVGASGSHSGLFDRFDRSSDSDEKVDETEQSGRIPFSPKAPELESDAAKRQTGKQESISGSLLIQLDEINKEGRGGRILLIAAGILLVGGLVGVGLYIHSQNTETNKEVAQKARVEDEQEDEVKVRTYSDDEQKRILTLSSQTVTKEEAEQAAAEEGEGGEDGEDGDEPKKVAAATDKKSDKKLRLRGGNLLDEGSSADEAFEGATKSKQADDGFRKGIDEGSTTGAALDSPIGKGTSFESMGGIKSDRSSPIYKPTDAVKKKKASGPRLTGKELAEGMRNVRRSIGICRQRHARRGGPLDARKIYLTIEIRPTGKVRGYELEPSKIQNTVFDRCLSSHKGRWSFPSFDGNGSQKFRAPFVLQ